MADSTNIHTRLVETGGRSGEIASLRRMLFALGFGGVAGCLLWMAHYL
ncbi:hypothetical protein [Actinosynnema sp. ALI-1.44]|nr:hypothetical protein [Actinosynnema sp. ALI-1.44]